MPKLKRRTRTIFNPPVRVYPPLKVEHAPLPQERVQKERHVGLLDGLDKELLAELTTLRKMEKSFRRLARELQKDARDFESYPELFLPFQETFQRIVDQVERRLPKLKPT